MRSIEGLFVTHRRVCECWRWDGADSEGMMGKRGRQGSESCGFIMSSTSDWADEGSEADSDRWCEEEVVGEDS